jgi:hypothetical protein
LNIAIEAIASIKTDFLHWQMCGAFYARKKASRRHDRCQLGANDSAYDGVLGISLSWDHLGGIPALAAARPSKVRQLGDIHGRPKRQRF